VIDRDIWAAAHQMIKMFGPEAGWRAALRADHLLDQGDTEGFNAWKRIVAAIKQLLDTDPGPMTPH
jgi:hypothetical protein